MAAIPRDARRNLLVTLLGRTSSVGLNFLSTIWVIRCLGPGRYGVYLVVLTVVTLLDLATEVALFEIVVREMAKDGSRAPEWLGAATLSRGAIGVVAAAVLLLVPSFGALGNESAAAVRVGALLLFINSFRTPVTYFRALLMIHWELGLWTLSRALEFGLIVLVTRAGGGIVVLLGVKALVAMIFVSAAWSVILLHFRLPLQGGRTLIRPLALLSLPVGLTAILMLFQLKGDILLIGSIVGPDAAGAFGAVAQVPEFVLVANSMLVATTGPLLARFAGVGDTRQFQAVFQRIFELLVTWLPGAAVVSCLLAGPLVIAGFGEQYATVIPEFRVIVWVGAMIPIAGLLGITALSLNLQGELVKVELVNALIYSAANLLLLRTTGTIASAWIRLLVVLIGPAWTYAIIRARSDYRLSARRVLPATASAALTAVVMLLMSRAHPLANGATGGAVYALSMLAGGQLAVLRKS
jgi:O-antigen/teichoic acid export membrane protein